MKTQTPATLKGCPVCSRPPRDAFAPFCSRRCADVDLQRWLSGAYVVADRPLDEAEEGVEGALSAPPAARRA